MPNCVRKSVSLFLTVLLTGMALSAQTPKVRISGAVKEAESGVPVLQAVVQLLSVRDSAVVVSSVTNAEGLYALSAPENDYILRIVSMGYVPRIRNIHVTPSDGGMDFGEDALETDVQSIKAATVVEKAPPMSVVADTVVINPAAFIVEDDADLAALLDKIPGIEVDERGNVTLNGRPVTQLLVNGKKFFGGDVKTGLKNIPARMLDQIRAYDRPSDFSRITGIDDGEEEPVLDLRVKPSFMKGWNSELRAAYGTSNRYRAHFDANRVTKESHTAVIANATDINNASANVSGRNQSGSGGWGDGHRGDAGASYASKTAKRTLNASLHYDGSSRWTDGLVRSENLSATSHYTVDTRNNAKLFAGNGNAKFDGEWHPSRNNTFFGKATLLYSGRNNLTLNQADTRTTRLTNSTYNRSEALNDRLEAVAQFIYTHRFSQKRGRSFSCQAQLRTVDTWDGLAYDLNTHYWITKSKVDKKQDSVKVTKTDLDTRLALREGVAQLSWNEPVAKKMFVQATYRATYKYYHSTRLLYDMEDAYPDWSLPDAHERWWRRDPLPDGYRDCLYAPGCAEGVYRYFGQTLTLNYRYVGKKLNLTAGVTVNRQQTRLQWPEADGARKDTTAVVWNAAPNLSLRYKHTKSTFLVLTYRSWAGQPSMDRLLPVANITNPLYIRKGNPGLKPSFTHAVNFSFNTSNLKKHFSAVVNAEARMVKNAVGTSSDYNPETGARTVTPVNIDGTWSAKGSAVINYTFPNTLLSLSSNTSAEYQNTPSYLYNSKTKSDDLNLIGRMMLRERASLSWRSKWVEAMLNLRGEYTMERSSLRPELNQDPYTISAGVTLVGRLPWEMTLTAEFTDWIQRGYLYPEYNRDYYILNARISQRFLKGRLSLSLIGNDLLGQMVNLTRSFSSERRAVSEYNGINRYVILQAVWRFK